MTILQHVPKPPLEAAQPNTGSNHRSKNHKRKRVSNQGPNERFVPEWPIKCSDLLNTPETIADFLKHVLTPPEREKLDSMSNDSVHLDLNKTMVDLLLYGSEIWIQRVVVACPYDITSDYLNHVLAPAERKRLASLSNEYHYIMFRMLLLQLISKGTEMGKRCDKLQAEKNELQDELAKLRCEIDAQNKAHLEFKRHLEEALQFKPT